MILLPNLQQKCNKLIAVVKEKEEQQPFYGPLSGTTRVSQYQKKHSPTHTYHDRQPSFINSSITNHKHHKHGTLSLLTLDPALPYRHLNAISKPTFSLILNWRHKRLCIPRRTLWRYTNVVLLLLLL